MKKKLSLKRESLNELSPADLGRVVAAGGTHITCYTGLTVCGICAEAVVELPTRRGCTPTPDA